jgi:hypothetical protein
MFSGETATGDHVKASSGRISQVKHVYSSSEEDDELAPSASVEKKRKQQKRLESDAEEEDDELAPSASVEKKRKQHKRLESDAEEEENPINTTKPAKKKKNIELKGPKDTKKRTAQRRSVPAKTTIGDTLSQGLIDAFSIVPPPLATQFVSIFNSYIVGVGLLSVFKVWERRWTRMNCMT